MRKPRSKARPSLVKFPAGTPKQVAPAPRPPRLSHHKKRAAWFRARVAWPMREAMGDRLRAARRVVHAPSAPVGDWTLVGPTNIGGRCTSLVHDPGNPDHLWIGAAGGGVWSSSDAGVTWKESWDSRFPLEIGSLAIDPRAPATIYCGTGEANLSADSYPGDGIYRSLDAGRTWAPWALSVLTGVPHRIGVIAVDPFDSDHVLVGGIGYGRVSVDNDFGGLYVTRDGGRTWRRDDFVSAQNYWCHCVVFDPSRQKRIFATVTPGTRGGIYRSDDGGSSWVHLANGLPPPERIGRTTVAIAPSDSRIVYAIASEELSSDSDSVLGVFRSADGGGTWRNVAGNHFDGERQMSYGNTIAVHPTDANVVICGGVDLHRSKDGGKTWRRVTKWDALRGKDANYAHADHHLVRMPAGKPGRVYDVNDGGLDMSEDLGNKWKNRSNGLAITMFYDIDVAQTDERFFGGGAQDNGTLITRDGKAGSFEELEGGDGGWMVVDPNEAGHVYASWQNGGMTRFRGNSARDVSPPFRSEDNGGIWMVYITIDPNESDVVYTGNQRLYRTMNDGLSWDALTPVLDGSPISAIEVAVADSNVIYVGTENGGLFRSMDRGATWTANLASPELPGVMVTRLETHPQNASELFVAMANFGNSHVFASTDAGSSWIDIDRGLLPDAPHHALLIRPDKPDSLYVCGDVGVFASHDRGLSWENLTANLPSVMVVDIVYHVATRTLLAATYGRSVWRLKL